MIDCRIIPEDQLSPTERQSIEMLEKACFGHVDPKEIDECFFAKIISRICAFSGHHLIGQLQLHRRTIQFDGKSIVIGGAVGACVLKNKRRTGIAHQLMKIGLEELRKMGCDVASLTVDLDAGKHALGLYTKLGFQVMDRKISFEDVRGKIRFDTGSMFIPLCSSHLFQHIMTNTKTFHFGKGYW